MKFASAPTPARSFTPARSGLLQRKCACGGTPGQTGECEECRKKREGTLQRKSHDGHSGSQPSTLNPQPAEIPPIVHEVLRSPGQPLDLVTRAFIEPRFGHDFGDVRVHTDTKSAESARAVRALAYTVGRDIVFDTGQFAPRTAQGSKLLTHELTHVVQQEGEATAAHPVKAISDRSDAAEVEAERATGRIMVGDSVRVTQPPNATLHALSALETVGVIAGAAAGVGVSIAALTGAFDSSKYRDCSPAWQTAIEEATRTAQEWISNALAKVNSVLALGANAESFVLNLLQHHFKIGPTATRDLNRVREGFAEIQSGFSEMKFECEERCTETDTTVTPAYIGGLLGLGIFQRFGRIHLCPEWFRRPDDRTATIVHEMAHRFAGKRGDVYLKVDFPAYKALSTEEALENADSFAQFASGLFNIGQSVSSDHPPANPSPTEGRPVSRKAMGVGAPPQVPPSVHEVLRSPGQRLDSATRAFMEPRFGRAFTDVRVHHDPAGAASARDIGAIAYASGHNVVFGAGRYAPETNAGIRLLAHELAHVAQHAVGGAAVAKTAKAISHPSDASEREAESVAEGVLSGAPIRVTQLPSASIHPALSPGETAGIVAGSIAGAGLIGVGIAALAGAFDRENFTETELQAYLTLLATTRHIEGHRNSDNKARNVVRRWDAGDPAFNIDSGFRAVGVALSAVELKRLLIKEMLSGVTADADERAILRILERATGDEIRQILDPAHGISVQRLDDNIQGDNHDRLEAILERAFPRNGASEVRRGASPGCTARQALMLDYAKRSAAEMVDNAIAVLGQGSDNPDLRIALECRFLGARPADVARIRSVFERTRLELTRRVYFCGSEGAAGLEATQLRRPDGTVLVAECALEDADSFSRRGGTTTFPEVFLCGSFFGRSPEIQAITIVHESVHAAGLLGDPAYQPGCGLALNIALTNPDSFAFLASDLIQRQSRPFGGNVENAEPQPNIVVGNFRNSGPVSPENQSPAALEVPGLGLDSNTGLNIMELRGEISGHRPEIEYDFKRTKEVGIWKRAQGFWQQLRYQPLGTSDDNTDRDEDLNPKNNHIYSLDGPGLPFLNNPVPGAATAEEAVYKGSYVESVNARIRSGPWTPVSNEFKWHTITWLEKSNGAWRRMLGANEIEPGPITIGQGLPYGPGDYELPTQEREVPV